MARSYTTVQQRFDDKELDIKECFMWNHKWKTCPVEVVNDVHSIYLQTVPTRTFKKFRGEISTLSVNCRICKSNEAESIRHLLSHCQVFLKTFYKRRHDKVLQYILFKLLVKYNLLKSCPPWYSKIEIKKHYESEEMEVLWDIPEYTGIEDENEDTTLRPDAKIIFKKKKEILVLEQTVPWITNREIKLVEKENKYKNIIRTIKIENPDYKVQQLTFVIDCLGGFSKSLKENVSRLGFSSAEVQTILIALQKIVVSEARLLINHFKLVTNL